MEKSYIDHENKRIHLSEEVSQKVLLILWKVYKRIQDEEARGGELIVRTSRQGV